MDDLLRPLLDDADGYAVALLGRIHHHAAELREVPPHIGIRVDDGAGIPQRLDLEVPLQLGQQHGLGAAAVLGAEGGIHPLIGQPPGRALIADRAPARGHVGLTFPVAAKTDGSRAGDQ